MNAINLLPYLLKSFILGVSLFLAIRCLITDDWHRETWRREVKRFIRIEATVFKRLTYVPGSISSVVFLTTLLNLF
jgi:hypothetical protein